MCCSFSRISKAAKVTSDEIRGKSLQQDAGGQIIVMADRNQRSDWWTQRSQDTMSVEAAITEAGAQGHVQDSGAQQGCSTREGERHPVATTKVEHFGVVQEGEARRTPGNQRRHKEEEGPVGWHLQCCKRVAPVAKTNGQQQEGTAGRGRSGL
ncbi:hypothetical protein BHE74_00058777 [Ensete ventricosum]|nr:hypothetical protein BHE74_00058777 [Ensete ventricosum]